MQDVTSMLSWSMSFVGHNGVEAAPSYFLQPVYHTILASHFVPPAEPPLAADAAASLRYVSAEPLICSHR
jgi:hypothetical protein